MRAYNVFLCPKCEHFEYRRPGAFGNKTRPIGKLICDVGKLPVELDSSGALAGAAPPPCPDFKLEARRAK